MRCFIAIELPEGIRDRLADLQTQLANLGRAVRWTKPGSIHLTLKFLGEVPDQQIADVCTTAKRIAVAIPEFDLEITGVGCFPPRGPVRIVWAGIPQSPAPLLACQKECEAGFGSLGFAPENRPYSPHLTIGRVNDPLAGPRIREALRQFTDFTAGSFTAEELIVFQSDLRPSGPIYTPLARAPFRHE